jgi:hypothetical protein
VRTLATDRLPRAGSTFLLGGLLAFFAAVPATDARASGRATDAGDVAATRAYIEADYRLARAGRDDLSMSLTGVRAFVRRTVTECPLAGEGSYGNHAANLIAEEVLGAIEIVAYHPDGRPIRAATTAFKRLRWSNGELTRRVHALAVKLESLVAMTPANICADVRAYAATGFGAAPETTVGFLKLFGAANVEPEEVPARLLKPYEGPRQVKQMRAIGRLESVAAEWEAHAVEQWMQVMRGLDLSV